MSTIYINTRQSEEHRIVIVKDGRLTGFEQDIVGWENRKGDIYKAVVTRIEEGLDAAFVNIGESKNGFLPLKHAGTNSEGKPLKEGDSVLVQVKKDHVGDKGAGMTTGISLAGCYLVLMPNTARDKALMSKTVNPAERHKTSEALAGLNIPEGMSVIVRTAGVGRSAEDLKWDLENYLLKLWSAVKTAADSNRGPLLIYRENNLMLRAVRDYYRPGEDEIYCDDADNYRELKSFVELISPENAGCVHHYEGGGVMVPDSVEQQIDAIYKREIKTESGARVVFDVTEAMVAIDVNSGQIRGHSDIEATALRANLDAADVIARHLRLRDMSGLVVVDFIDMNSEHNRRQLEEHFIRLLRRDRARVQWTPLSRFGLMELSRQRLSRPVEESQSVVCQTCRGTGRQRRPESFALRLLRQIRALLPDEAVGALVVQAPAEAAVYLLNEKRVELRRLEDEYNCEILISPMAGMYPPDYTIRKVKREGRIGVSYEATGVDNEASDKMRAEEMKRRFEKRSAGMKPALIQTVLPEERPEEGLLSRIFKAFGFGAGDNNGEVKSQPRQKRKMNHHKRRGPKPRRSDSSRPQTAQNKSGAPSQQSQQSQQSDLSEKSNQPQQSDANGAGKKSHRRRRGRKLKSPADSTAILASEKAAAGAAANSETQAEGASVDSAASPKEKFTTRSPASSPSDDQQQGADATSNQEQGGRADASPELAGEASKHESQRESADGSPSSEKLASASQDEDGRGKTESDHADASAATMEINGTSDDGEARAADEESMTLTARLAQRYDKSEAAIRVALSAIGDDHEGVECMGDIPADITDRLDEYFQRLQAAYGEPLNMVESPGTDTPDELQQQIRELEPTEAEDLPAQHSQDQ